jgi:hypothetical protein
MTGKKYAHQYSHTQLPMAGWGLEQQIDRRRGCHRFRHHAVMALIQQVQERPSGLPGGGTQGYDLSLNHYKELIHDEVEHRPPLEILAELRAVEQEILQGFGLKLGNGPDRAQPVGGIFPLFVRRVADTTIYPNLKWTTYSSSSRASRAAVLMAESGDDCADHLPAHLGAGAQHRLSTGATPQRHPALKHD